MADPEKSWKYGAYQSVLQRVTADGDDDPNEDLLVLSLLAADDYIDAAILEARLDLPAETYSTTLVQAANYYAIADALQPGFNQDEDENKKVTHYLSLCDKFLTAYINKAVDDAVLNDDLEDVNPYSRSKSPVDPEYDFEHHHHPHFRRH